jgi:hypothetical protein
VKILSNRNTYEFIGISIIMLKNHRNTYGFWAWWSKSLRIHMLFDGKGFFHLRYYLITDLDLLKALYRYV